MGVDSGVRIDVFGPLRVDVGPTVLTAREFRGIKPKQVLQILVAERGHTVSKDRLADLLWGEALPRNHHATLETYVSVLRQTLQPGARARDSVVLTDRGGYALDQTRVHTDLDEFDRLLGAAVGAEPGKALTGLSQALGLVRGQVLEDEPDADWAQEVRNVYRQRQVQVLIDAGRLSLLTGETTAALGLARRAVALNPLAEPAYQVLMTAAYALWRQDEALAAYDQCRRLLAEELGADPLDETVALHLSILRHEDVAEMLPSVRSARPRRPPPDRVSLVARDGELIRLQASADRAAAGRLTVVLVTGAMGLGKTRLVETFVESLDLPVAANRCCDLERHFPFLALSLALRAVLPELSATGLPGLDALLQGTEQTPPLDELARLRVMESLAAGLPEGRPFVLLLDDVQWADAESLTTVSYLQRRCRNVPLLVLLTCDRAATTVEDLRALRPDVRVDLALLSGEAVGQLGGPDLYAAAGGTPLFIADWLDARARALPEPFTPELRERVITSCWDLGPAAYRLLSAASAVDQRPLSAELLAVLLQTDLHNVVEQLDLLLDQGLLVAVGDDVDFASPAVRSILNGTLSPARRSLLRQSAAGAAAGHTQHRRADDRSGRTAERRALHRRATDGAPRQAPPVIDLVGPGAELPDAGAPHRSSD